MVDNLRTMLDARQFLGQEIRTLRGVISSIDRKHQRPNPNRQKPRSDDSLRVAPRRAVSAFDFDRRRMRVAHAAGHDHSQPPPTPSRWPSPIAASAFSG